MTDLPESPGHDDGARYFFVHVMKTSGSTFRQHLLRNFAPGEVYPDPAIDEDGSIRAYTSCEYLLGLPAARHRHIRAYSGHFPWVVTDLLGGDMVTMTMLREPVARTISFLKDCQRNNPQHLGRGLQEIYEDAVMFGGYVWNHQSKLFALAPDDVPLGYASIIEVDDRRLATAKENLERVDVVGLAEHHDEFLDEVRARCGWTMTKVPDLRVSPSVEVPRSLLRMIEAENRADLEFYEFARDLRRRSRDRG